MISTENVTVWNASTDVCDRNANYDVSVRNASKEIVRKDGV
jgi:hypothetical protein